MFIFFWSVIEVYYVNISLNMLVVHFLNSVLFKFRKLKGKNLNFTATFFRLMFKVTLPPEAREIQAHSTTPGKQNGSPPTTRRILIETRNWRRPRSLQEFNEKENLTHRSYETWNSTNDATGSEKNCIKK